MAAGGSSCQLLPVTDGRQPKTINKDHVSYACAVLYGRLTGQSPTLLFEDIPCLRGHYYQVHVIWDKPRGLDMATGEQIVTEAYTPPDRECRGSMWARSDSGLAHAIRSAAVKIDQRFPPITLEEFPELTCTLHLYQAIRELDPKDWRPEDHGLMLTYFRGPNPSLKIKVSVHRTVMFLKGLPNAYNWSLNDTVVKLLGQVGVGLVDNSDAIRYCRERPTPFPLMCFETSTQVLSTEQWDREWGPGAWEFIEIEDFSSCDEEFQVVLGNEVALLDDAHNELLIQSAGDEAALPVVGEEGFI
jgi:AMMECR1 domain-containing protein